MKRWFQSIGCTGLAFVAGLSVSEMSFAKGGVEATQLDLVAVDSIANCHRTFFRSTQHYKNTIFFVPRVVPGAGLDGKRTFDIVNTANPGEYILNLRLYFPPNSEVLKTAGASTLKRDLEACDMDEVKWSINSRLDDKSQWVRTTAPIPLTSIEVKIPNIKDVGRIGISLPDKGADADEADVLEYYGKSLTAIFKITAEEKAYFENQVVSPDGLVGTVRFRFQARHRDGSIVAKVDVNGIQAAFAAAVKGQAPMMAKADVAATLKRVVDSRNISITAEAGQSDSLEKIQNLVIDKILKETSLAAEAVAGAAAPNADDPGTGKISVKIVMEAIATKLSREISYNQIALPETATAQAEIRVNQNSIDDPNIVQVYIKSHYQDPSTGFAIKAGETISISPNRWYVDTIDYFDVVSYLTESKMNELELRNFFPDINAPGMEIHNSEVVGKPVMAVGRYTYLKAFHNPIAAPSKYYWIRTEKYPVRRQSAYHRIVAKLENLDQLNVAVSFTKVGNRNLIPLAALMTPNPYFAARFDQLTGRLMLTALKDLGTIEFRELENFAKSPEEYATAEVVTDSVVQVKDRPLRGRVNSAPAVVLHKDRKAIVKQKVLILNVTRPEILRDDAIAPGSQGGKTLIENPTQN